MQGLRENRKKPAILRKALVISDDKTLATATAVGGNGAGACFLVVFLDPLKYTDPDGREDENETTARDMLYQAVYFIQKNSETDEEKAVAASLTDMMNNRKVQLDNVQDRERRNAYGFFDDRKNTVTGKPRNIIVIDINNTVNNDFVELIDTMMNEGFHAVQSSKGPLISEIMGKPGVTWGEAVDIEQPAWNMGLQMSNKYREQNGKNITRTYWSRNEVYDIMKEAQEQGR
jgi:hypothetical protein